MKRVKRLGKYDFYNDIELCFYKTLIFCWGKKFLIFFVSIILVVPGYFYGSSKPKIYKTAISIDHFTAPFDQKYLSIAAKNQLSSNIAPSHKDRQNFILEKKKARFKSLTLSKSTLANFVEQLDTNNYFRLYLKKKIDLTENLLFKIEFVFDMQSNKYFFIFPEFLSKEKFLNDYFFFINEKILKDFKNDLLILVNNKIDTHKKYLKLADIAGFENPVITNQYPANFFDSYFHGTKVLSARIDELKIALNEITNIKIEDNSGIKIQYSNLHIISKPPVFFSIIAFVVGLFLLFTAVFIKFLLFKKY